MITLIDGSASDAVGQQTMRIVAGEDISALMTRACSAVGRRRLTSTQVELLETIRHGSFTESPCSLHPRDLQEEVLENGDVIRLCAAGDRRLGRVQIDCPTLQECAFPAVYERDDVGDVISSACDLLGVEENARTVLQVQAASVVPALSFREGERWMLLRDAPAGEAMTIEGRYLLLNVDRRTQSRSPLGRRRV